MDRLTALVISFVGVGLLAWSAFKVGAGGSVWWLIPDSVGAGMCTFAASAGRSR